MNLVKIANWIQDGYREYYKIDKLARPILGRTKEQFVLLYVMRISKGQVNPNQMMELIQLENSVPDEHGTVLSCIQGGPSEP